MEMDERASDAAIVHSTVKLGQTLGLAVVAEGVETASALERLRAFGCDVAQGYLISRPAPAAELTPWLHEQARSRLRAA
jgi:EAL domain-containing protein (putative c-di-GMP-specific phosphodiesterase class I)